MEMATVDRKRARLSEVSKSTTKRAKLDVCVTHNLFVSGVSELAQAKLTVRWYQLARRRV